MRTSRTILPVLVLGGAIAGAASTASAGYVINVGFSAQQTTVTVGQQFSINIVADLPVDVLGWGLQFHVQNPSVVDHLGPPLATLPWHPTPLLLDGNTWQFGGLAFPDPVSGQGVVLALLQFKALEVGETDLILSINPSDPTQGFVIGPGTPPGLFPSVQLNLGHVTVVPAPGAAVVAGALALAGGRKGRRRR